VSDFHASSTHVSRLIFTEDHVIKIKRPVAYGFIDLTTVAARTEACRREVALNRRLAPDVYEGVGTFVFPDGRSEPAVVMKRLPASRCLTALIHSGDPHLDGQVREVATVMAEFHRVAVRGPEVDRQCTAEAVARLWDDNLAELRTQAAGVLDPRDITAMSSAAHRYLDGRPALLDERIRSGRAVDGHGDLLCDDIFCLPDGPRILDCLEFDARLRRVDALMDMAALAVDLERLGRSDLSALLLATYARRTGDGWPESLLHHFMAYRATVRAKVALLGGRSEEAGRLVRLALNHLSRGRIRLVLIGGLPGTGKSTLAEGIQAQTGWAVLSSDLLRKRMAGLDPFENAAAAFGAGLYRAEVSAVVYTELLKEAEALLRQGYSVVLDASWLRRCWRDAAADLAQRTSADLIGIRCRAPRSVANQRMIRRRGRPGLSDATPAIAEAMADTAEPWYEAAMVDTSGDVSLSVEQALGAVGVHSAD
jgi:uncharacterized protein